MRSRRGSDGSYDNDLRDAGFGNLLQHTRNRARTVAQTVRFPAPETVWSKCQEVRITDYRRRKARADDVDDMFACDTCDVEDLRSTITLRAGRQKRLTIWLCEQCRNNVAPRIEVGGHDDEL